MNAERFPAVVAAAAEGRILVDNAAGAQLPDLALDRMARYLGFDNAQKGALFTRTRAASALVDEAKTEIATLLGTDVARVGIGANATSIAFSLARLLASSFGRGDRIVVTAADHEANVAPWVALRRFGAQIDVVPVDAQGDLDEAKYRAMLERGPKLVALPWASNVTGSVYDVPRLAALAKAAGAIVVVDGVQALPHFALDLGPAIDFMMVSAYKIYAPHLGFWYASAELAERLIHADDAFVPGGDARYWTLECGTQSHEGLAGWLGTIAYLREIDPNVREAIETIARYEERLSAYAREGFAARADRVRLYGRPASAPRLPVFAFNVAGVSGETLAAELDEAKIEARFGDYYAPRLLEALAPDRGASAMRLSFAHYNTHDDVDRCFAAIDATIAKHPAELIRR